MAILRSRRLEALLGVGLENAEYRHFAALVPVHVPESFDLDFKRERYGDSATEKRDLAGDVAALANTAGGLLILGIDEDKQARAIAAPGVVISDTEIRRIHQILADGVAPLPVFEVLPAPESADPEHGFLVIVVPRSPRAPHGVLVNEGLRFPVRNGTTTRYLSEPEVATAYRNRFARARGQAERAESIQGNVYRPLSQADDHCWVTVSLVPDMPGEFIVDHASLELARREFLGTHPTVIPTGLSWRRADVALRRLMLSGSESPERESRWLAADLHADGAGTFALNVLDGSMRGLPDAERSEVSMVCVSDEEMVNGILTGLRFLARHARDRAGAGGDALIRAGIQPGADGHPIRLSTGRRAFGETLGRPLPNPVRFAEAAAPVDSLADDGPDLVAATYLLATDLFQQFGLSDALQVTRDGALRLKYWSSVRHQALHEWAEGARVDVTDEMLPRIT